MARREDLASPDRGLGNHRHRLDRARGSDASLEARLPSLSGGRRHAPPDRPFQVSPVFPGNRIVADVFLGQTHGSEGDRFGGQHPVPVRDDDLRRASPDVDEQQRIARGRKFASDGERDEPGFLLPRNDLDFDAAAAPHGLDELRGVFRFADGARRDGADRFRAGGASDPGEPFDRGRARFDRLRGEPPRRERRVAEPDHLFLASDGVERSVASRHARRAA